MSSSTKPTEKTSSRKRRHISLAAQVNMLIILITLGVSLLMAAINANTYYRAMIDPSTEKLEKAEADELVPYLEYFLRILGTEEMKNAREP
ncbi:MAG: hypothetical protein Q4A32_06715 [Lachnospiraceae bacterium]|nr:hypothetical protein [Lachnospiraceae bacterium]